MLVSIVFGETTAWVMILPEIIGRNRMYSGAKLRLPVLSADVQAIIKELVDVPDGEGHIIEPGLPCRTF